YKDETIEGVEEVFKRIDKDESKDFEYKTEALGKFQTAIDDFKKKKNRLPNAAEFLRYLGAAFEDQETEVDAGMYAQLSGVYKDAKELAMQLKHGTDEVLQTKVLDSETKAALRDLWKWIEEKGLTTLQKSQDNDEELDKLRQQCEVFSQENASQKTSLETQMKISTELEKQLLNARIEVDQLKDQLQSLAENQETFQTIEQQLTPLETDVKQKDQDLKLAQKELEEVRKRFNSCYEENQMLKSQLHYLNVVTDELGRARSALESANQ
ncbi:viral A-type inclusion protein, partial [Reticulomyxa filosa]